MIHAKTQLSRTAKASFLALVFLSAILFLGVFVNNAPATGTINTQKAEVVLKQQISAQTGVRIAFVRCPRNVAAQQGGTFTCTAYGNDGSHAPVLIRQTDDQGSISYSVNLVKVNRVQTFIRNYVQSAGVSVRSVKCPVVVANIAGHKF